MLYTVKGAKLNRSFQEMWSILWQKNGKADENWSAIINHQKRPESLLEYDFRQQKTENKSFF